MELTYVLFGTEDGKLITGPAVHHEGALWLVASWLPPSERGKSQPAVAIRLPMEAVRTRARGLHPPYALDGSVPKSALAGESAELEGLWFEAVRSPPWTVDHPSSH